ncbi:MAG: hypothetical protein R2744_09880 [Bacteroidales bacterium]
MKEALNQGKELPPFKLAYSSKTFVRLQGFLPSFEHIYKLQRQSLNTQVESNREYQEVTKKARLYLSHFIRVMNMAVQRGDIRKDSYDFFGITGESGPLPSLNTEKEMVYWGEKIIEGEAKRLRAGRTPISNPTIAVVKVHFEKFKDALQFQKTLHKRTGDYSSKIAEMRREADEIILSVWNEVEESVAKLSEEKRRVEAEKYGLVYVFRKHELEKIEESSHLPSENIA